MKPMKLALMVVLLLVGISTTFSQELFDALKNNDLPKVKALLKDNPQLLSSRDESGNTPLHLAVRQKQNETVSYLLGKGADNEMTPFISPDGDYLIYTRGTDMLISYRNKDGTWDESKSIGSPVSTGFELCPLLTPDGKYLVFLSGREGESHPFWVSARVLKVR